MNYKWKKHTIWSNKVQLIELLGEDYMKRIAIVIPALNPLPSLLLFLDKLAKVSSKIIVVNDGSDEKYRPIFDEIKAQEHCLVIEHEENRGKGAALKTGFLHVMHFEKNIELVMTVGAHGQHAMEDIEHVLQSVEIFSDGILIGVRRFRSKDMPAFSFLGNQAASILFELLFHKKLHDLQSGLRVIPKQELFWLAKVPREKFNYDVNMLIEAIHRRVPIYEFPIGYARLRKNSLMHYDEVVGVKGNLQQIWSSFIKDKKTK